MRSPRARARLSAVIEMGLIGWLVVGFLAGILSGWVVGSRTVRGCLPTTFVGVLGGVIGGWLFTEMGLGDTRGFIGAVVVAFVGAVLVRLVFRALEGDRGRPWG